MCLKDLAALVTAKMDKVSLSEVEISLVATYCCLFVAGQVVAIGRSGGRAVEPDDGAAAIDLVGAGCEADHVLRVGEGVLTYHVSDLGGHFLEEWECGVIDGLYWGRLLLDSAFLCRFRRLRQNITRFLGNEHFSCQRREHRKPTV